MLSHWARFFPPIRHAFPRIHSIQDSPGVFAGPGVSFSPSHRCGPFPFRNPFFRFPVGGSCAVAYPLARPLRMIYLVCRWQRAQVTITFPLVTLTRSFTPGTRNP